MIYDTIIDIFEKFSAIHGFEYIRDSLPYRPCGKIRGELGSIPFQIYIYQGEAQSSRFFDTVFTTPGLEQLPNGFCIDHIGDHCIKSKSFDDLIEIRSRDPDIVHKYMNGDIKNFLIETFNEIHKIESSLFKLRCSFRISDHEISLTVGRFFHDLEELTEAYQSVVPLLISVRKKLQE